MSIYDSKYGIERNYKDEIFPIAKIPSNNEFETVLNTILDNLKNGNVILAQEIVNNSSIKNGIRNLFEHQFSGVAENAKGIYVYSEKIAENNFKPVYVGISKSIIDRKRAHLIRTDKGTATLALKIAREVNLIRKNEKDSIIIADAIKKVQDEYLKKLWVTIYPYTDDSNFLLPMLEIYLAVKLKAYWNTFETH